LAEVASRYMHKPAVFAARRCTLARHMLWLMCRMPKLYRNVYSHHHATDAASAWPQRDVVFWRQVFWKYNWATPWGRQIAVD